MMQILSNIFSLSKKNITKGRSQGFGTFTGVYLPALVTMIGMISFLQIGFVVGHTSLSTLLAIISLGALITLLTALSIAGAASNMHVKGGGTYYILSRCFGIEIGASIGIALYIAHTIMAALCIMGFCSSLFELGVITDPFITGLTTLLCLASIACFSANAAIKTQLLILGFILLSLGTVFVGTYQYDTGISETAANSPFWVSFALFYPAITGIEAGVAMSGDLKNPRRSIILGSIAVTFTGFVLYLLLGTFLYIKVPRVCLQSDLAVWQHLSSNPLYVTMGFWLASLSSALGCLLSAPRTLYAMAKDGIFPKWLMGRFGSQTEPRMALFITAFFAALGIYYGDISKAVPILTMVTLIIYGMLNLVTGIEGKIGTPSWRPTFRVPWWLSILGACLCLFSMLMIDSGTTFLALFLVLSIYLLIKKRRFGHKFDDIRQSILFSLARYAIYELAFSKPSLRSWRPNFLVLSESGCDKSPLLQLTNQMTHNQGFLTLASVVRTEEAEMEKIEKWEEVIKENLRKNRIRALVEVSPAKSFKDGLKNIIQNYGCGSLIPNTVVLGECVNQAYFADYVDILRMAAFANRNLLIVRGKNDFFTTMTGEIDIWWDERRKPNTDLMTLLAFLLEKSKPWNTSRLTLKSVVFNEKAHVERQNYFTNFCENARLPIRAEIYLSEDSQNLRQTITEKSTRKGLVFFGLMAPKAEEDPKVYFEYIKKLFEDTKEVPFACFVLSRQKIDLHSILT